MNVILYKPLKKDLAARIRLDEKNVSRDTDSSAIYNS